MDLAQVLIILLSGLFIVFLIVTIGLLVLLIQANRQIRRTIKTAEASAHKLEDSVNNFNRKGLPLLMIRGVIDMALKSRRQKDEKKRHDTS